MSFDDRQDITEGEKPTIHKQIVKAMSILVGNTDFNKTYLNDNVIISSAYWVMNIVDSQNVAYGDRQVQGTATTMGQQAVGFAGLAYLMGFVKEPTNENNLACTKRWSAGLAGVKKVNALSEACMSSVWLYIVENKSRLYGC
ncbi:unnamed protein product [Arctia plantaginis]|uniref:Uncharacterized protein n=1 Tax=Arctia plantaginis TaxID=874455 RepID=A0A8S0ZKT8_ARCPL|nr:unnamed protein product [Arctia plantaginis]CAB3232318.1 unnamed protein product [Arctia plantaginis]